MHVHIVIWNHPFMQTLMIVTYQETKLYRVRDNFRSSATTKDVALNSQHLIWLSLQVPAYIEPVGVNACVKSTTLQRS
jgi:hypothetical protein